jgi:hypothetical protein
MSYATDFGAFWDRYPRKVGKLAAFKAYQKARSQASADEILAGVENYRAHLPSDAQFICHPTTFLNQGRWMDSYETPTPHVKPRPAAGPYALYVPPWKKGGRG